MADILSPVETFKSEVKLRDVYKKENLAEFSEAMEQSNGKCLILVHPFFGLRTIGGGWDFDSPRWDAIDNFIADSKNLANKSNLPIFVFMDGYHGMKEREQSGLEKMEEALEEGLQKLYGLTNETAFFTATKPNSPAPLSNIPISIWDVVAAIGVKRYQKEYKKLREDGKNITDLILKLKIAGLKTALVAGCNFKGSDYANEGFSRKGKFSSFFASRDTLSEHYQRLEETGQKNPDWKHVFQKISPHGCVSGVIQTLSFCDIRFGMTNALYPQQMPKSSIIEDE